jgi:hypothetical protein
MITLILEVLLFAISITILLSWGFIKQQRKNDILFNKLINNAEKRIIDYLNKNDNISKHEVEGIIKDTKSSIYWSKTKLKIIEPKTVSLNLLNDLINKNLIEKNIKNKYSLVK